MVEKVANDVYKLKRIGPRYAEMLESIGVSNSIQKLRHRVPRHLFREIEEQHGPVIGMSLKEVTAWIEEAKAWKD